MYEKHANQVRTRQKQAQYKTAVMLLLFVHTAVVTVAGYWAIIFGYQIKASIQLLKQTKLIM